MQVALRNRLPVNARHELRSFRCVTLGAGGRNVSLVNRRLRVGDAPHIVGAVTIAANRGFLVPAGHQLGVNAIFVGAEWPRRLAGLLHHRLLAVAGAAGGGDVFVAYLGSGIAGGQNRMDIAVAIVQRAACWSPAARALACKPAIVGLLLVRMALRAGWLGGRGFVRNRGDVLVAIGTGEHAAVNGALELLLFHLQAHLLAVFVLGKRCVAMASQTILIGELRRFGRRLCLGQAGQQQEHQQKFAVSIHKTSPEFSLVPFSDRPLPNNSPAALLGASELLLRRA